MPEVYLFIVILLFVLAISDLIVGVSNDAVNFLNSALGSKVAPRHTIMIIASMGILIGATFSSGMMEIARKGIFNPEHFYFSEIMTIFLAVMITDIILLDLFNTFGMPTSTTVSIVFELLGAAVAVSILKISAAGESINTIGNYINSSSAIIIISGIFISVLVAFVTGSIVQHFSRLLFTFHIKKRINLVGSLWSGLALSAMTYFLLIKGVKGASFISAEFISWIQNNTIWLLVISFVFWSAVMQIFLTVFKINILKIVVLFGTFALAMAFAGNDLVNFIGVPIAGFESYLAWSGSGDSAETFSMTFLNQPVRTQTYLLVIAGIIMITTLWFSKKAQSVTETEINLGRQDEGAERFSPNALSKAIVRYSLFIGNSFNRIIPDSWINKTEENFQPLKETISEGKTHDPPAFDLVRASVNLTVASMLIAFATSLKLPLSTTYVSFMVAMGTSLADRAWGRSSAVFRIAGVINVIGGWFFTAFIAFTAAATFASVIYFFGIWGIIGLVLIAVFLISRTFIHHRQKEQAESTFKEFEKQTKRIPAQGVISDTAEKVGSTLETIKRAYDQALNGLLNEDRKLLKKAKKAIKKLKKQNIDLKRQLIGMIKRIDEESTEASRIYLLVYDLEQDILQSASLIVKTCVEYIENSLDPIQESQAKPIRSIMENVDNYLTKLTKTISSLQFAELPEILHHKKAIFKQLENHLSNQVDCIKAEELGIRKGLLVFSIALETKDLIAVAARFAKLYNRIQQKDGGQDITLVSGK